VHILISFGLSIDECFNVPEPVAILCNGGMCSRPASWSINPGCMRSRKRRQGLDVEAVFDFLNGEASMDGTMSTRQRDRQPDSDR
jgi:hypothetical protein